ncbi:MAG TPA: bifunctional 4-hydroxy-3-methylbut-2-enyl diphosphate reductase/30S ribosomal protein S1 [Firmicutes bacterium]|nr:bifunctional 4-hydroxy-3-methylbut-2-enyl diphosphate reductase/30S ribosomal protein S1 [Bacillota bacterium]
MQVAIGEHSGFCFGVKRAVEIAEKAGSQGIAFTLGPLVHNPQVVAKLRKIGVIPVSDLNEISDGCMIVPSHGLPRDVIDEAYTRGLRVVHATCPYVRCAQERAAELNRNGYQVFIVGDEGHKEVVGLLGWAGDNARVVMTGEDVTSGSVEPKVGVVCQTTQTVEAFRQVLAAHALRAKELVAYNTICNATWKRQEAARKLARSVDAVVVVGGRASANTRRLVEICEAEGAKVYWVEGPEDLNTLDFSGLERVGLTAGASTPNWVIEEVVERMSVPDEGKISELGVTEITESKSVDEIETVEVSEDQMEEIPEDSLECADNEREDEELPQEDSETSEVDQEEPTTSQVEEEPDAIGPEGEEQETVDMSLQPALVEGDIVEGTVVAVEPERVLVDIGLKSEGVVPRNEISRRQVQSCEGIVNVGDRIEVLIEKLEAGGGEPLLSKRKADIDRAWDAIFDALDNEAIVEGEVTDVVKGGIVVDVGLRGFVPASHASIRPIQDLGQLRGETLRMKVLEADRDKKNVVLSARQVQEEELAEARTHVLESLNEGIIVEGIVRRVVNFGAFVDIGDGVEGLLHVSDMAWTRTEDPRDVVSEGERIRVKVLAVDRERERISLGLKQTLPDPWDDVTTRYPVGSIVKGTVTKTVDFGAFVQLEPGIEGLVHISQLADRRVEKPDEVVSPGDEISVKVISVRPRDHRIGLSLKEAQSDEEKNVYKKYADKSDSQGLTIGDVFGDILKNSQE